MTDPLAALSDARRKCERARQQLPADAPQRAWAEWATPTLWVRRPRLPLFHRRESYGPATTVSTPVLGEGIVVRKVGEFIGRRRELREARRALEDDDSSGLVIHAIGGVGKSTLAAEIIASAGSEHGVVISRAGAPTVDAILEEVGAQLLTLPPDGDERTSATVRQDAELLRRHDIEWADRQRALAQIVLPTVAMIVLLDNFEDNLQRDDQHWVVRDPELAEFVARWARRPGQSKLIITSRHPFELPGGAQRHLNRVHLGPLSAAETQKLVWQLPGLDALPVADRVRAYRDVGGHPRTLEYLDALLRGGHARFVDIAERMELALSMRGIADPTAWMATAGRDIDSTLAESVTLAVDDIVLSDLLQVLASTPLARELVIGASVYRSPIDRTALIWQLADETQPRPDPERDARITRFQAAFDGALARVGSPEQLTPDQLGLAPDELAAHQTDIEALRRPPVFQPDGFNQALNAGLCAGLIAPITASEDSTAYLVHRWTARALTHLDPELTADAHHRAARYWRWRVDVLPQSEQDDLDDVIEARHHHHAAGEHAAALELSDHAILQLQTWGQYGHVSELCRQTLDWVPAGSAKAVGYIHELGIVAQLRGNYDTAEQRYTQSVAINERLGNQAGLAAGYHQLGMLSRLRGDYHVAEQRYTHALGIFERLGNQAALASGCCELGTLSRLRGDYDVAEQRYTHALGIFERLGYQAGLANGYGQLGALAQLRGHYDTAEQRYTHALGIFGRLGNQAGLATGYHHLGVLAQARGDYDTAEQRYVQSLEINERLGNQASLANSYHHLGMLAQARGDYDTAEQRYVQSLEINERLGDQAGFASSYHQLGRLAHYGGDYDAAEQRYTQAIQINERLGNQADLATSCYTLAMLMTDRDDAQAIVYDVRAFAIWMQMGDRRATLSVQRLAQARTRLGDAAFTRIAAQSLDKASLKVLTTLLDEDEPQPVEVP